MLIAATLLLFLLMQVGAGAGARARTPGPDARFSRLDSRAFFLRGVRVDTPLLQVFLCR
jgi:hypothetical protein